MLHVGELLLHPFTEGDLGGTVEFCGGSPGLDTILLVAITNLTRQVCEA
jgi:hypothetical protein